MNSDPTVNSNTLLNRHALMYALVMAFVAGLTAFDGALATGAIPLPHSLVWLTPILAVMAISLTTTLPKVVDGLPPATSQASIEAVAKYQQPTVATLNPAPVDTAPVPVQQAQPTVSPTQHVITLQLDNGRTARPTPVGSWTFPPAANANSRDNVPVNLPPAGPPAPSPAPEPAANAATPA